MHALHGPAIAFKDGVGMKASLYADYTCLLSIYDLLILAII